MKPRERTTKPTELAITLSALGHRYDTQGWLAATQVAANLRLLGFDPSLQQVVGSLTRMCKVDAPWVERRRTRTWGDDGEFEYRVTRYGRNDIDNRLKGVTTRYEQVGS